MFAAAGKKKAAASKVHLTGLYCPDGKKWGGPGTADRYVPGYLASENPGDYGPESARHAGEPKAFERLRKAEVLHIRWAMLGTLRCLTPELLQKYTAITMVPAMVCGSGLLPQSSSLMA